MLPSAAEVKQAAAGAQDSSTEPPKKKKRKGPKGPNPLSVKKKKPKQLPPQRDGEAESNAGDKRKRPADSNADAGGEDRSPRKKRRKEDSSGV